MIPYPIELIEERHLQALIAAPAGEDQTLEFKLEPYGRDSSARHELCADVSAMANSSGGDLIIGVKEDQGVAASIAPWTGSADDELLRMTDMLANGIEPRLPGLQVKAIVVSGGVALLLRVPASWNGPHRVKTNQQFFIREGPRRRQLDMPEIRSAFLRSSRFADELRDFRAARIGKILANEGPTAIQAGLVTVLHILPLQATAQEAVDPVPYATRPLSVISGYGEYPSINIDGALSAKTKTERGALAYTQLFRNGRIEGLRVFVNKGEDGRSYLPAIAFETELLQFYRSMLAELAALGVGPPYVLTYSILRAKGALMGVSKMQSFVLGGGRGEFDRDVVLIPEHLVSEPSSPHTDLKPIFDLVWQAAGIEASWNFDKEGNYSPRQ